MKQVLLIGAGGSGKSTLAKRLAAKTGLPLIHLDAIFWRPGWKQTPESEWVTTVDRLAQRPEWIMDGNFGGTLELRLSACDTVILLDTSPWLCLWRVIERRLRYAGRSRPEMAPGCHERLDARFLWWVATYRIRRLPGVLEKLDAAQRRGKRLVILRTALEVEDFLSRAPTAESTSRAVSIQSSGEKMQGTIHPRR